MLTKRIIPCLDVKEGRVVKGTNFVGLRDAGDPVELASIYDRERADELVFLDITASFEKRKSMLDVINRTAGKVFMPLTVGGGISTVEDMDRILLIDNGEVVAIGSHEELMRTCKPYQKMVAAQSMEEEHKEDTDNV